MLKHNYISLEAHSRLAANIATAIAYELGLRGEGLALSWWLGLLHDAGWITLRPGKKHDIPKEKAHALLKVFMDRVIRGPKFEDLAFFIKKVGLSEDQLVDLVNLLVDGRGKVGAIKERGVDERVAYAVLNGDALATTIEEREVRGVYRRREYARLIRYFSTGLLSPARPHRVNFARLLLHLEVLDTFLRLLNEVEAELAGSVREYRVDFSSLIELTFEGACYVMPEDLNSRLNRGLNDELKDFIDDLVKWAVKWRWSRGGFKVDFYGRDDYLKSIFHGFEGKLAIIGCPLCQGPSAKADGYNVTCLFPEFGGHTFKSTYVYSDGRRKLESHVTPCPQCVLSSIAWYRRLPQEGAEGYRERLQAIVTTYIPRYYDVTLRKERLERLLDEWDGLRSELGAAPSAKDLWSEMEEESRIRRESFKAPYQALLYTADVMTKNEAYRLLRGLYSETSRLLSGGAAAKLLETEAASIYIYDWLGLAGQCDVMLSKATRKAHFTPISVNSWRYVSGVDAICIAGQVFTGSNSLKALKLISILMGHRRDEVRREVKSASSPDDLGRAVLRLSEEKLFKREYALEVLDLLRDEYVQGVFDQVVEVLSVML